MVSIFINRTWFFCLQAGIFFLWLLAHSFYSSGIDDIYGVVFSLLCSVRLFYINAKLYVWLNLLALIFLLRYSMLINFISDSFLHSLSGFLFWLLLILFNRLLFMLHIFFFSDRIDKPILNLLVAYKMRLPIACDPFH